MDNEILELYEQVKDKLTIEEFQAKINDISKENEDLGFVDDYYAAEQVVNNIIGASKDDQKSNGEILNIGDLEGTGIPSSYCWKDYGYLKSEIF